MIVRAAGFSSSEEDSADESGYSEASSIGDPSTLKISLQNAIENDFLEEIQQILSEIHDYQNFKLSNGYSPSTYAATLGKPELLNFFLNYRQNRNVSEEDHFIMKYEAVMALCSANENFNQGHLECIDLLLNSGVCVSEKDRYGVNALMTACKSASSKIVEKLLSKDNLVNEVDNNGWSPLFYAANRGDVNIVTSLLKHGADINITDKRDRYPFTIATDKGFSQIASLLKPVKIIKLEETADDGDILPVCISETMNFNHCDEHYYEDALAVLCATSPEMSRYTHAVREKCVSLRQLLLMRTEEQLRSIGIIFSFHRKTILKRIREFHLGCWSPNSFGLFYQTDELQHCTLLSAILTFVATLNRQLLVLRTSFEYTEDAILNIDQISCDVINALKAIRVYLLQVRLRLNYLRKRINAIQYASPEFLRAQEIEILKFGN